MSRKHFIAIAGALASTKPSEVKVASCLQWVYDVEAIAKVLEKANRRFNRERFLTACGFKWIAPEQEASKAA